MRRDVAEFAVAILFDQRADDRVRRRSAEQVLDQPCIAREPACGGAYAAAPGITHQRGQARWSRKPDAHGMIDAVLAQRLHPGDDRPGIETELLDDVALQSGLRGGLELRCEHAFEFMVGNARVSVRIARDADLANTAA